jgi:hypothetical protein
MKHVLTTLFLIAGTLQLKAQTQMPDGGNASQGESTYTGYAVNSNIFVLPSYAKNGNVDGNPYFSKDWIQGSVTTKDNQAFGQGLVFMYSKVDGRLFFKKTDSAVIMQADPSKISTFTLITDKPHTFIHGDFFSADYRDKFFEVLVLNEKKYSLVKLTTASFVENSGAATAQSMTHTDDLGGSYTDKVKYYIFKNGQQTPVDLKKKSFQNALSADKDKVEKYFKEHSGNFNEAAAVSLITEINEQLN